MLFSIFLFVIAIEVSFAISGSGAGDFEIDNDCIPVHDAIFQETHYSTLNDPETIARCICACTDHMPTLNVSVQSYSECNKIDSCVEGCVIGKANKTRNCTDICCENECLTIGKYKTNSLCETMQEHACLFGCEKIINIIEKDNDGTLTTDNSFVNMLPTRDSLEFVPSETLPVLYVNQTLQRNQNNISQVIVIQLTEELYSSENFYVLKDLSSEIVDLEYFACKEMMLSYAYANKYGLSEYSAISLFTISGVNPLNAFGIDAIAMSFMYDNRVGFFGHYSIHMSWIALTDLETIDSFIITMRSAIGNSCLSQNFTCNLEDTNNDEINCKIVATEPSGPPLSECIYQIEVISIPIYANQFPSVVSYRTFKTIQSYSPPKAKIKCVRYLNDDGYFDVLIHITLDDYIFREKGIDLIEIIPKSIEMNELGDTIDQDAFPIITKYLDYSNNQTSKRYEVWSRSYTPKLTEKFIYEFVVYLSWRDDLSYTPTIQSDVCSISALAPRPETVDIPRLITAARRQSFTTISFAVAWETPQMNGQFIKYQLCLINDVMNENNEPNNVFCKESFEANQTYFYSDSWLSIDSLNVHCLQLQIRAINSYFPGNWSIPLVVPLDELCESTSTYSENVTTSDAISILTSKQFITTRSKETSSTATGQELINNTSDGTPVVIGTAVGVTFLILTSAILLIIIGLHCHLRKRKRRLESINENEVEGVFQMGPRIQICTMDMSYDEWEIPSSKILMESILGQGAFGEVFKGIVIEPLPNGRIRNIMKQSSNHQVAIKLLKTSADGSERVDFLKEIDIMKRISERTSPHVVNMIGCVTAQEPLCLVIEYIEHGDLLTYLRLNRKNDSTDAYPELQELTSTDLVSFGYQIAAGLEFISSMGIVHRDVACRNVLVGEGKSLKISDFGMSRLIGDGEEDVYVKTTGGRLPLKWMAIESISDRQFTVASDVWSYGIALWEIATLGGFPYPTVENDNLLRKLKSGYRMDCPDNCSTEIYHIMLECWSDSPKKRPKLSTLRKKFDNILSAQHGNSYIDLQTDESSLIYTAPQDDSTRSPSPPFNCEKNCDTTCLQVTNPWIRNSTAMSLSRSSFAESDNSRPMSLSIWDTKENTYVDQPQTIA